MDLITIHFSKPPVGFVRPQPQHLPGVRFDDGKIAYQDEHGEIRAADSEKKLKEALVGAIVEARVAQVDSSQSEGGQEE